MNGIEAETWWISTNELKDDSNLTLEEKINLYNHQINRIKLDGEWYFSDLTQEVGNKKNRGKYMLMKRLSKSQYEPKLEPLMLQSGYNDRITSINFDEDKTYTNLGLNWVE